MSFSIIISNNENQIRTLKQEGYCPVECSINGISIMDDLCMDHHGDWSHLESVAIRAYRDHYGARAEDPHFVVCGHADADAVFACLSLAGLLPHPEYDVSQIPSYLHSFYTKDLSGLAATIALLDTDPIGHDVSEMEGGDIVLTWNALTNGGNSDSFGADFCAKLMLQLVDGHPSRLPILKSAKETESSRIASAQQGIREFKDFGGVRVSFVNSLVWGFDVWYGRNDAHPPSEIEGWENPVVLAFNNNTMSWTVGCPNKSVAEKVFGDGGLKNLFPTLDHVSEGWGGREAIGGSPRGFKMSWLDFISLASMVEAHLSGLSQEELKRLGGMIARHKRNGLGDTVCVELAAMARGEQCEGLRTTFYNGFSDKFFQILCDLCGHEWDC